MKLGSKKLNTILITIAVLMFVCIMTLLLFVNVERDKSVQVEQEESIAQNSAIPTLVTEEAPLEFKINEYKVFSGFSIEHLENWIPSIIEKDFSRDIVIMNNSGYLIKISQFTGGSSTCYFEGTDEQIANSGDPLDLRSADERYIESDIGTFAYYEFDQIEDARLEYRVCGPYVKSEFTEVTYVGMISFELPQEYSSDTLEEMIDIIASIKFVE